MKTLTRSIAIALASVILMAPTARADYTATHSGGVAGTEAVGNAVFTGDGDSDLLQVRVSNGRLMHNRFSQGDAGFVSDHDFDSAAAGEQRLSNSAASAITVNAGDGVDTIWGHVGTGTTQVLPPVTFNGGAGPDSVDFINQSSTGRAVTVGGSRITGQLGSPLEYSELEYVYLRGGDSPTAHDTFRVETSPTVQTLIDGQHGDDRLVLANGTSLGQQFIGGRGTDTLDYSDWTAPVATNLGVYAYFSAILDKSQVNPPTTSTASGEAGIDFPDAAAPEFGLTVRAFGMTAGQITAAHVHTGAPGSAGPEIFDIGPGTAWTTPSGPRHFLEGLTDPDVTEPALRHGKTYVDLHSTAFPGGEIRGRLELHPRTGYGGPATGLGGNGAFMVENVIGGSAGDDIKANPLTNRIEGRAGNDTIRAADGEPDAALDCGEGSADVLHRDAVETDRDEIVAGCESVSPATPAPPSPQADPPAPVEDGGGGDVGGTAGDTPVATDTVAPETEIRKIRVRNGTARLAFDASEPGARFECGRSRGAMKPCTSPATYRKLEPGRYRVRVVAIDAAGNADPTPAVGRWRVGR